MTSIALHVFLASWTTAAAPARAEFALAPRKSPPLVAVTLADGRQMAGQIVWQEGDGRPWLRISGVATVLIRPLQADQIVAIKPLAMKPASSRSSVRSKNESPNQLTDAEMAHRLLFGEP